MKAFVAIRNFGAARRHLEEIKQTMFLLRKLGETFS